MRFLIVLLSIALSLHCHAAKDASLEEKTSGEDVVDAVIKKITRAKMPEFPEDHGFFKRMACVESQYGNDERTYTPRNDNEFYGGIWQITKAIFDKTQDYQQAGLQAFLKRLQEASRIDWISAKWEHLWQPMYSGLAARIYAKTLNLNTFPATVGEQATFWKKYFNSAGNEADFKSRVEQCEKKTCKGRMDLAIILDGSGSVALTNFQKSLTFVNDLMRTFESATAVSDTGVRFGFLVYSTENNLTFSMNNTLTPAQREDMVSRSPYPAGGTFTGQAMLAGVRMFEESGPARPGVAKVMTVITDGATDATDPVGPAVAKATADGVTVFGVGVGNVNMTQIVEIAQNHTERATLLNNFNALTEFFRRMNEETCKIPQTPAVNTTTTDKLEKHEKRYFTFPVPEIGLMITLDNAKGKTVGYFSYEDDTPSSAMNDGEITGTRTHIEYKKVETVSSRADSPVQPRSVYISVVGVEDSNEYSLHAVGSPADNGVGSLTVSGGLMGGLLVALLLQFL